MIDLQKEYDYCWAIFHQQFPYLRKPILQIRSLKKAWGSCNEERILLNKNLERANVLFVRHVVFHEMCHLLYPNHKREFYDLLKRFDPMQQIENEHLNSRVEALKKRVEALKNKQDE